MYQRKIVILKNGKLRKPFMGRTSNRKAIRTEKDMLAELWNCHIRAMKIVDYNSEGINEVFDDLRDEFILDKLFKKAICIRLDELEEANYQKQNKL